MITEYSLLLDTSLLEENLEVLKSIYLKLVPQEYNIVKPFLVENSIEKQINNVNIRYRFVQNFMNKTQSIEIFLKEAPDENIISDIKMKLKNIKEIVGYRLMKVHTKVKIEIETI